jgi:hypothetical protein
LLYNAKIRLANRFITLFIFLKPNAVVVFFQVSEKV